MSEYYAGCRPWLDQCKEFDGKVKLIESLPEVELQVSGYSSLLRARLYHVLSWGVVILIKHGPDAYREAIYPASEIKEIRFVEPVHVPRNSD